MFIRKWRYLQNLENARSEGIRDGKREATDHYYSTVCQLEKDKELLTKSLENACRELEDAKKEARSVVFRMDRELTKKGVEISRAAREAEQKKEQEIVEIFANELACWQKMADVAYYIRRDQDECSRLVDKVSILKELANKLGICGDVYERAYQIYDFRNSGMEGYTLRDGKIVKVEQEEAVLECPFVEEPALENHADGSACSENTDACEGCPGWCPELAGTTACPEYGHAVPETADEEAAV